MSVASATELWSMSATELADAIRTRQASSREVVEAHLLRIEEVNPAVNAVTVVLDERAVEAAKSADRAVVRGADLPPLHGVPFTVPRSRGRSTLALSHRRPEADARRSRQRVEGGSATSDVKTGSAKLPPPWFVHTFWRLHRRVHRLSGGRFLWTTASKRGWGALHLTTTGWRSGRERSVIVGYLEDGANLVTLAMNGWDEGDPAWWLNLKAHPDAVVRLARQDPRPVHARPAAGEEGDRLWHRWASVDPYLDAHAARRSAKTVVVVLEPRPAAARTDPP